ncbi:MAG: sigma-70 family RNA polymerase sigma factor [bacterium]|nr:sigma-70 family RNA polymerase sigma factor [bacterium]
MADRDPDQHEVARAVAGDRAAIQQLLIAHHDHVASVIAAKVPADLRAVLSADDVCQDAYVAVFQQITSFQPHDDRAFRRWLLTIAERKLVDAIRTLRTAKRGGGRQVENVVPGARASSVVELLDMVAVHEHTPSRSAAHRELVGQVQNALLRLKADYRDALQLHYIECLSVAETAQRMGRSEGAVLMLCNRALRQLTDLVGDPANYFSRKE